MADAIETNATMKRKTMKTMREREREREREIHVNTCMYIPYKIHVHVQQRIFTKIHIITEY